MSVSALQDFTFVSRYANFNEGKQRRETWEESITRVKEMHQRRYPQIHDDIEWAFSQSLNKRVLGSQRALQFGGKPIEKNHARIYNCISAYCDRLRFFQEAFFLLLCGCGVGESVQKHHIDKLPAFLPNVLTKGKKTYVIQDSIEGWADALGVLLSSYFPTGEFPEYEGYQVVFEYHLIRPKGSPLKSSTGKAPGPIPLRNALEKIRLLLTNRLNEDCAKLKPINAYDVIMHSSDAVLAGGVRRSANLTIFSPDDEEMLTAKTGNWFYENPQRGRSNNSALLLRDSTSKETFVNLIKSVREFGEPGFIWSDDLESLYNPCVEIGMFGYDQFGNSGWQGCVSGDTKLITKNGLVEIEDVIGQPIEIWNGNKWAEVSPFITGYNRELYRVHFNDGSYLDCTENHKFLIADRFQNKYEEVKTLDLLNYSKYVVHVPRVNIDYKNCGGLNETYAYEYGFILGDGTARPLHSPSSTLMGRKINLPLSGIRQEVKKLDRYNCLSQGIVFNEVDNDFAILLKENDRLPRKIFSWNYQSIINFISGWIDADGSKTESGGCRVYGTEGRIRDLQLLLTKVGINSSVCKMASKGEKTNYGIRNQDIWYANIPVAFKLKTFRVKVEKRRGVKFKGKYQNIKKIEKLPGLHTSYCLEEKENHQCVFNNVLTKQCNLSELNGKFIQSIGDFEIAARAGAIIGTCQAGYTDFPYLGEVSERIFREEALLGVSITGMMDNPDVIFDPLNQSKMAQLILEVNSEFAHKIGINPASRATCVKPSGTASCVLGCASGIHPHHSKRYFRNVQSNTSELPVQFFKNINPLAIEDSVWSANKTDSVLTFCIEAPDNAKLKEHLKAVDLLEYVKLTQQNWVASGKRPGASVKEFLHHNVSNTCMVGENEWTEVADYIYENRHSFAGISLLPSTGDLDYQQAPFIAVHTPKELVNMYGDGVIMASGLIVDGLHAFDNNLWNGCNAVFGLLDPKTDSQKDWIRRVNQFAERYLDNDLKKTCYLMKEVSNWKKWCDLRREYKNVDYSKMVETSDNTEFTAESACAGGKCEF